MAGRRKPGVGRKKRGKSRASFPRVTREQQLENRSREVLKRALHPWLVTDWHQHDYGIDAIVEIVVPGEDGDGDAISKRFAVQLKATEGDGKTLRVPPHKVWYWLESTERVLLVSCQFPSERLTYRWIDDAVVEDLTLRSPGWYTQDSVTLTLGEQTIGRDALSEIARVAATPRGAQRFVAPGTYARLHRRAQDLADDMARLASDAKVESVVSRMAALAERVRATTYVLALTGPSRAGKSTLLNALVARDVAPVGTLPTTAVATLVTAGNDEHVEVEFADGSRKTFPLDPDVVAQYATQEQNPDNAKGVRLVHAFVGHMALERGLAIADAPGLHDASPEIRAVTKAALRQANAILYVLDASPAVHGGFALSSYTIRDLRKLSAFDRLIVVFNKADTLDSAKREELHAYVAREFEKYGISEELAAPPQFVSAAGAVAWRRNPSGRSNPLAELEDVIWRSILTNDATGLKRLQRAMVELRRGGADFIAILRARRSDGTRASELVETVARLKAASADLRGRCDARALSDRVYVVSWLEDWQTLASDNVRTWLASIPTNASLPAVGVLREHVAQELASMSTALWQELRARFDQFSHGVREEAERVLQRGRTESVTLAGMQFMMPAIEGLASPPAFDLPEAWFGLFGGGMLGLMVGGFFGLLLAGAGLVIGAVAGGDARRRRDIDRLCSQITARFEQGVGFLAPQANEKIALFRRAMVEEINHRLDGFAADLERDLPKLGEAVSAAEAERLEALERQVVDAMNETHSVSAEIAPDQTHDG